MRRREFIAGLGGAALYPVAPAMAQQRALPVIGLLYGGEQSGALPFIAPFRQGLGEQGYVEGRNVEILYRFAENRTDRLPELVADLVARNVAAIATSTTPATIAAKEATTKIPVIFEVGVDPVGGGLVASLNRPGGNLTGVNSLMGESLPKMIDLMAKVLPTSRVFAFLFSGGGVPNHLEQVRQQRLRQDAQTTADRIGRKLVVVTATTTQDLDDIFPALRQQGVDALILNTSPFTHDHREKLAALAAHYAIPAIYQDREGVEAGGLMSYGIKLSESFRLVGVYTGRVLKGERPQDLPVQQSSRFEFLINLKAVKTLGLTIPPGVLAIADEVIE
jgi:putative tryptophan/tyrosine transport system substrate-binding protein